MGTEPDRITVLFESVGYNEQFLKLLEDQGNLPVRQQPDGAHDGQGLL